MSLPDYVVGGGTIYFNDGGGARDLGNLPEIAITRAIERLEHFTAKSSKRMKDEELVTQTAMGLSFTIDDLDKENMNVIMYGDGVVDDSFASGSAVDESKVAKLDRVIFTDKGQITNLVVTDDPEVTTYVLGDDYEIVDAKHGVIKILSSGAISEDEALLLDYDFAASTRIKVNVGQGFAIEGDARIIFKVQNGDDLTWIIPKCSLQVDADTPLLSDDWSTAEVTLSVLWDESNPGEEFGVMRKGV